jgi:hypothetical protein
MGFLFTVLYVALTVLSPADLVPELAPFRIMLWLAALALLASIPALFRGRGGRFPQFYLMVAFIFAICLSRLLNGWFGGVPLALADFLPVAVIFFLIAWNVSTISRFRILTYVLVVIALYLIARGAIAFYTDDHFSAFAIYQPVWVNYQLGIRTGYLRICGLGFLSDPNDFAQFLSLLLPLLLPFWNRERRVRSFFLCLLPAAILLFGIYLTNSRGALLGLALLAVFLLKDRMGAKAGVIISPLAIIAILALNQSGRAMSLDEDSALGRVNAWSDGLGMFQRSPLWGIGYNLFLQYHERTAHNSFVLCLSELGLMGTFVWLGLIVTSVQHLQALPQRIKFPKLDIARWSFALRASLYTVLATSWFLSRTYSSCFYIILALGFALSILGNERASFYDPDEPVAPPRTRWVMTTLLVLPVLVGAVYATVRMRGL